MEKTIEIKAIDKEKALKRALNILGVELTENEAIEIVEKVKPHKKFFGLFGTEPGIYKVSIKTKEKKEDVKEKKAFTPKTEKVEKSSKYEKQEKIIEKTEKVEVSHKNNIENTGLEKEITEKDINSKNEEEIILYQYTLENGAVIKLLPYGLIRSYRDEKKINNIDNEWKKVKPTESFIKELETKINNNFKNMPLFKNFAIRDIIDYKDEEQFRMACKNMGSKRWKTNNSKFR